MECKAVFERIEAIAAGDLTPDAGTRTHVESCTRCASALATARRIESALAMRTAPSAPARFTPAVVQRLRRERWRSEQQVDRLFNFAMAAAMVLVVGGVVAIFNIEGLLAFTAGAWDVVQQGSRGAATDAAPSAFTYVSAVALLISALGTWWWAERRLQY